MTAGPICQHCSLPITQMDNGEWESESGRTACLTWWTGPFFHTPEAAA